jgi:hypothetical protein
MLLFVVVAPILILYASGYRLDKAFNIASTGGIFVTTSQSGTNVYLNNELVRTTSIFQRNAFIQNLKPGKYTLRVGKDNFQEWRKTLSVFPETVTEARSFILPSNATITLVPQKILDTSKIATSTISNPDYIAVSDLFKRSKVNLSLPVTATSTDDVKELRNLLVKRVGVSLQVTWQGLPDNKPAYFCQNEICKDAIFIKPATKLGNFDFFPGRDDLIIMSLEDGIYVSEIDDRSAQNIQKLFDGANTDFRIKDNDKIFIRNDKTFYSVEI